MVDELRVVLRDDGLAEMEKSPTEETVRVRLIEWDKDPLVPVTVMVYVPVGVEDRVVTVRVEAPLEPDARVVLEGLSETDGPDGDAAAERFVVPVKLFRLVSVIVLVPDEPGERLIEVGLAEMEKSPDDDIVRERFLE